jgi:hypothetical protein
MQRFVLSALLLFIALSCGGLVEPQATAVTPAPSLTANQCLPGFAECDGDPKTICETDLHSSNDHCGTCGVRCAAGLACTARGCVDEKLRVQLGGTAFTSCVRAAGGELRCWGRNEFGEAGDGTQLEKLIPTGPIVSDGVEVTSEDPLSICVRHRDGGASCWGARIVGEDHVEPTTVPVRVEGLDHVAKIETSAGLACASRTDGTFWCWGNHRCGWFGDEAESSFYYDTQLRRIGVGPVSDIGLAGALCVLGLDGRVSCWGMTRILGDGSQDGASHGCGGNDYRGRPGPVANVSDIVELIGTGYGAMCARDRSGSVSCWGSPESYDPPILLPKPVEGISDATRMGGFGLYHGCFLRTDGVVWCAETGGSRPIGNPTVREPGYHPVPGLTDVVDLHVGSMHTCALRATGEVYCWGSNDFGQIGDGTREFRREPTRVALE